MTKTNARSWYRIENKSGTSQADVYIYDDIAWYGVTAQDFARSLATVDADRLVVHINSVGGDAFDGIAIMNAIKDHPAKTTVIIDGIAASAASVIAMGGDEIVMNLGSQMMIHDASALCIGQAKDMRKTADSLDTVSDSIAAVYAAKTGQSSTFWRDQMREECWYTATEAVDAGLADRLSDETADDVDPQNVAERMKNAAASKITAAVPFTLSATAIDSRGRERALPPLKISNRVGTQENNKQKEDFMSDLKKKIVDRLGMTDPVDKITDEAIVDAIAALKEPAELPEGTTIIDVANLESLKAQAAAGLEAVERENTARIEGIVDEALNEGKFAPALRENWIELMRKNEETTTDMLNKMPAGTVPVEALGETGETTVSNETDEKYAAVYGENK